ncbi:MAG: SpoIID/LytB domain-containing protein [bacterium]
MRKVGLRVVATAVFVAAAVVSGGWIGSADAAGYGYAAQEMIRSSQVVEVAPGQPVEFTVGFKNAGTALWANGGSNFVSIYTYDPKYRSSKFQDPSWYLPTQPARLATPVVPGQIGMFKFVLRAPAAEGEYVETFHLAAEDLAWIPGGQFSVTVRVRKSAAVVASAVPAAAAPTVSSGGTYAAQELSRSAQTVSLQPGESQTFSVDFKNVGSATWLSDGANFVSIYTFDPKYRASAFRDVSWYRPDQPARLSTPSVAPGKFGTVSFRLHAPSAPGTYRETFHLAAEDRAWISGGQFTVTVVVGQSTQVAASSGASGSTSAATTASTAEALTEGNGPGVTDIVQTANGFAALKMIASGERLTMAAGDTQNFRVAFKNVGLLPWVKYGSEPVRIRAATAVAQQFRDPTWTEDYPAILQQDRAEPGQLAFFDVRLRAPRSNGLYSTRFTLYAGEQPIEGGMVEIPVEVTGGSVSAVAPDSMVSEFSSSGSKGPNIRVGLLYDRNPVVFTAAGTYTLVEGLNHLPVRQLSGVTTVLFDVATLRYTVTNGAYTYVSDYHVHLRPDDPAGTILEISNYENRPTWDTSINFNRFRGDLSVHYMRSTGRLWVIEELPIEDYMRGLAETSNGSPQEYQKALVTAARTYALYVLSIGGKHKSEYHDVNTGAGDQVYKGYVSELVRPNVVRAVEDTRGAVVTYNGEMVVTPYFSRSDGRTRSWSEVWYGSKPWLVSVPAPYDAGKTLWGHGVGMSAADAVGRAAAGATWTEILRYYYTGTEIRRIY